MNNKASFLSFIMASILVAVTGCETSSSVDTAPYSCSYPCFNSAPSVSTNTVSSATGGTVVIDVELNGDITNVASVFVYLADITSGSGAALTGRVDNPTQSLNSISVTVPAGTAAGTYYPWFSVRYVNPSSSGGEYYLNSSVSSTNYTYYEWTPSGNTLNMLSPFAISFVQVQ